MATSWMVMPRSMGDDTLTHDVSEMQHRRGWLLFEELLPDRLRILPFDLSLLAAMLISPSTDHFKLVTTDAPADLQIVGMRVRSYLYDQGFMAGLFIDFLVSSESFEKVDDGAEIPTATITFTTRRQEENPQ